MDQDQSVEELLWQSSLTGDGESFAKIFDMHKDRVFRHSLRQAGSIQAAEDATAVAFLELWRKRKGVRVVNRSILPWLLVTATNSCRNERRSRRRYRNLIDSLPRTPSARSAEDEMIFNGVLDRELSAALSLLSTSDAALFGLVALEGYSPAEAAEALGMTSGAARTRIHRVRVRLKAQLETQTLDEYLEKERV
ncbi:RNA polymerase sigma factor [Leucobacter sp. HY1908]